MGTQKTAMIWRPVEGQIKVKIPVEDSSKFVRWLSVVGVRDWSYAGEGAFRLPRSRWSETLRAFVRVYSEVVDLRDARVSQRIVCTVSCQIAKGPDCKCSCGGLNHRGEADLSLGVDFGEVQILWSRNDIARTERVHRTTS